MPADIAIAIPKLASIDTKAPPTFFNPDVIVVVADENLDDTLFALSTPVENSFQLILPDCNDCPKEITSEFTLPISLAVLSKSRSANCPPTIDFLNNSLYLLFPFLLLFEPNKLKPLSLS